MSKKITNKLIPLLLLLQLHSHSQYTSTINKTEKYSVALRGKLLGFFIIEDCYFSTGTIGAEIMHKSGHSFGADLTFFHWRYEHDDMEESPLTETYEKRTYAYLDYKYRFAEFSECDLYFNAYDKLGTYRCWREGVAEGYNDITMPALADNTNGIFNQVGAGIGIRKFYTERSYIDISVNGGKVFTKNHEIAYDESLKTSVEQYNVKNSKPVFYIRINFGIILKGEFAKKPVLKKH